MSTDNYHEAKPHGGCEHGHDDSPLPQGMLVVVSGVLTGGGLILGWMNIGPGWLQTAAFAPATVVIGEIISSTLLTLVVLPGLYRIFRRKEADEV